MEVKRPDRASRGSGPARRANSKGPRKDVILRLPEDLARRLKILAAMEDRAVNDICTEAIEAHIKPLMRKHDI